MSDQDQRTLPPTPKRIQDFRKRGEVARSRDLTTVGTIAGAVIVGGMFMPSTSRALLDLLRGSLRHVGDGTPLVAHAAAALEVLIRIVAPPTLGAIAGCILAGFAQLGAPPVLMFPKLDFSRIFGFGQLVNIFNPKAAAGRALLSMAKVAAVVLAAGLSLSAAAVVLGSRFSGPSATASILASLVSRVVWFSGGALAVLAAVDFVVQKRGLMKKMRMTPEEYKREHRDQEGDPQIRQRRRRRMRELARRRLKQAVISADVVLVNPTEYAVALRYKSGEDRAPRVVAKGRGPVAEKIREMARAAGVPIVAQPPLTRLIHKLCAEGKEIPAQVYQAVAEVLAYIYKLKKR